MTGPYVLLDDDPTGAQLSRGVTVLLDHDPALVADALADRPAAVHIVTNSRALPPTGAYRVTREAATATLRARPDARLVLRGDSTLRAHLVEEYTAVRDVAFPGRAPVLLLAPALPSAGRVTVDGVHYLLRDGERVPLSRTEYAGDGGFAYPSARLLDYAEHRSGGLLPAARGRLVPLAAVRGDGPAAVLAALRAAAAVGPAAVAVDAETDADLAAVAAALDAAGRADIPVVCRCAPALAALLAAPAVSGAAADGAAAALAAPVPVPAAPDGVLVVCGSYVSNTTRQLAVLRQRTGAPIVEADVAALAGASPGAEITRLAAAAGAALTAGPTAVLTTPRQRPAHLRDLDSGLRIAAGLAAAAAAVYPLPSVVVTKGGITSAVVVRDGFGVRRVRAAGPLAPGVSLWLADGAPAFAVFPGNVGQPAALADLVRHLLDPPPGR